MVSALEITTKDRLGTIKEVPQWIKKYHELIVADGFSHLWSSFIKICMLQVLIGNTGILSTGFRQVSEGSKDFSW